MEPKLTYENVQEVLRALLKINAEILVEPDRKRLLKHIAERAMTVFDADSCRIHHYDAATQSFVSEAKVGLGARWGHSPRPQGLGERVLRTGRHVWEDHLENLNPVVRKAGIKSAGVFPLHPEDGEPVGVLYLHFLENPHFTEQELKLVYHFSYHAGLAIQQTELRENDRRHIEHLEALRDAGVAVAQAGTLRESLGRVVKRAVEILDADAAILYPWDAYEASFDQELVLGAGLHLDTENVHFLPPRLNGLTHTLIERGVVWEEDVEALPATRRHVVKNLREHVMSENGLRAFIGIALSSGGERVGVLYVFFRAPHKPTTEQVDTIRIFSEMAATRIQLAKLSEAQEQAARAEAIAILSAGAAQFAHRLANVAGTVPMIIHDITESLREAGITRADIFTRLDDLRQDTQGLMNMADQLKLRDIGTPVVVDLAEVVRQAVRAAHVQDINPAAEVHVELHQASIAVRAVRVFLVDIVVNLLQNSAQAQARTIHLRTVDHAEAQRVELHVVDDGAGMSKAEARKVFMPLFSTKKPRALDTPHGTGLWVSRHQLERMGGSLSMESTPGKGSRFTISLRKP